MTRAIGRLMATSVLSNPPPLRRNRRRLQLTLQNRRIEIVLQPHIDELVSLPVEG